MREKIRRIDAMDPTCEEASTVVDTTEMMTLKAEQEFLEEPTLANNNFIEE